MRGHRHLVVITMLSWKNCSHMPVFHCILVEILLLTTKIRLAASMTPFQSAPFTVTVPKWMSSFCNNSHLLYKHQWNTRWAFARKHDNYLHTWKDHRCYGYIITRTFHNKELLKWNGLIFHWYLYNKQNITELTHEIFFNTQREISYLHSVM